MRFELTGSQQKADGTGRYAPKAISQEATVNSQPDHFEITWLSSPGDGITKSVSNFHHVGKDDVLLKSL